MRKFNKLTLFTVVLLIVFSMTFAVGCGGPSAEEIAIQTVSVEQTEIAKESGTMLAYLATGRVTATSQNYGFRVTAKNFSKDFVSTNIDSDGYFTAVLEDLPTDVELNVRAYVGTTTPDYGKTVTVNGFSSTLNEFKLDYPSYTLFVGESVIALKPQFIPAGYYNKTVSWESSNESVAVVDNGMVTPIKAGRADITATTHNGLTYTCQITVKERVSVEISHSAIDLYIGEQMQLSASVLPETSDQSVIWESSNSSIASVNSNGYVTGKKEGKVFIKAKAASNDAVYAICEVTVEGEFRIVLNKTILTLEIGASETLNATIITDGDDTPNLHWSSSNVNAVTVDQNGKVTAVGHGMAYVTVDMNGISTTCQVAVKDAVEVKFILNGDVYAMRYTGPASNNLIEMPENPKDITNSDYPYYFRGWYTDTNYTNKVTETTKFLSSTTVYAKTDSIFTYTLSNNQATITGFVKGEERANVILPEKINGYSVIAIGYGAFEGSSLETVDLEAGILTIFDDAFRDCVSLDTVTFADNSKITAIGDSVFRGCEALTTIKIPETISTVGELSFYGCKKAPYNEHYSKNLTAKDYYANKFVFEFMGEDVMPIGGYIEPSVGYFADHVSLEQVIYDWVASGTNIMVSIGQRRFGTTQEHYEQMYQYLEEFGGMMINRGYSGNTMKYASYAGNHAEDEPGVIQWMDELYYYSEWVGTNDGRVQGGGQAKDLARWKEVSPRKLSFTNLLPINSPIKAFVFGATYYGYNSDTTTATTKKHPLMAEYMATYANYETYYKTYIEEMKPQVFCYDFYPLWQNGLGSNAFMEYPNLNGRHFEQLDATRYYAEDYNYALYGEYVPFWNFVQIAKWGGPPSGSRQSTSRELLWQVNTALAYGSKGYMYFVFTDYGDINGGGVTSDYAGTTPMNIDGTKNTDYYNMVLNANTQSQAMAKWLLNATVDHVSTYGANPNGEVAPARSQVPRNKSIDWAYKNSSGANHIVSYMTYYANNNEYDKSVAGDMRQLYFVCNNGTQSKHDGAITINFEKEVSGSYIYNGVEKTFKGSSLTVDTIAGEGFAILLDK